MVISVKLCFALKAPDLINRAMFHPINPRCTKSRVIIPIVAIHITVIRLKQVKQINKVLVRKILTKYRQTTRSVCQTLARCRHIISARLLLSRHCKDIGKKLTSLQKEEICVFFIKACTKRPNMRLNSNELDCNYWPMSVLQCSPFRSLSTRL